MKIGFNRTTAALIGAGWVMYQKQGFSPTKGWDDLKQSFDDYQAGTNPIGILGTTTGAAAAVLAGSTLLKGNKIGMATAASLALGEPMFALGTMAGGGPSLTGGKSVSRRAGRRAGSIGRRTYSRARSFRRRR